MTNEETLNLLKPIMLDGTEKVGDKVYSLRTGDTKVEKIFPLNDTSYPIVANGYGYTQHGYLNANGPLPHLFKVNPFEWLAKQNNSQERVIEVRYINGNWQPKACIKVLDGYAVCWANSTSLEDIDPSNGGTLTFAPNSWRELPTEKVITKEEALKMLSERGVDTTNLIIE